jgi:alanine racemase
VNKKIRKGLRTWIEIDKKAIVHNYQIFRNLIDKKCKIMSVVKSNAYGHSLLDFAKEQEKLGVDYLGVDSIVEGIALRKEGIKKPILVLGYTLPEMLLEAIKYNIEITVSNFETLKEIEKIKNQIKKIKVHIKVDTGMNRHGFLLSDMEKLLTELKKIKNISVVGLFTHFAMAKNPAFPQYTKNQIAEFEKWSEVFKKNGFNPIKHASATSGAILFKEAHFDMVRIGIGLYGIWPSSETRAFAEGKIRLAPVLSWKAVIGEIKAIKAGSRVGYDCTETVAKDSKIAIIPVGYWHGLPRALSGIGKVIIGNKKCKILGRVCMDIIMVDITYIRNVKVGDEVILIGKSEKEEISADDISNLMDASTYEFLTRINPLIKRIYI